ncbi:hypothetical protein Mapa_001962 [Marchantia paleacea]|nr:hypothetical protein Mapa_001962 [Marchantia paleacea]
MSGIDFQVCKTVDVQRTSNFTVFEECGSYGRLTQNCVQEEKTRYLAATISALLSLLVLSSNLSSRQDQVSDNEALSCLSLLCCRLLDQGESVLFVLKSSSLTREQHFLVLDTRFCFK